MVSWKGAAALLVLLLAAGVYAWVTRPQPPKPAAPLFPCEETNMVGLVVHGQGGQVVEIGRARVGDQWNVLQPVHAVADQESARILAQDLHSIKYDGRVDNPASPSEYGLDNPRETATCREQDGSSYTLTVGKETFDGGAYYALRDGDRRVYVISSVPIDDLDRNLKDPPVKPGAS